MEAINDSSKLVARALELLKNVPQSTDAIEQAEMFNAAIRLLEEALNKLVDKM